MPSSSRLGSRKMIMIMIMAINMIIITINKSKVNATILKSWPILKDGSRGWKKLVYLWNASFVDRYLIGSWQSTHSATYIIKADEEELWIQLGDLYWIWISKRQYEMTALITWLPFKICRNNYTEIITCDISEFITFDI